MSEPILGEIRMYAGSSAPPGWALCNGQLLPISLHPSLFSLLGTSYGGDGRDTFALPDLRGRLPMHWGTGPGLSPRTVGARGGTESVTLTSSQMPSHAHKLSAFAGEGDASVPEGCVPAVLMNTATHQPANLYSGVPNTSMSPKAIGIAGGGQPHDNLPPFQCVSFIIAIQGVPPSNH
ncbi:phage tail protein [Stigmatella aurantiaca]|uniref:Phage tail collar domain protein n=1 Tax=Stigmatella aurantiaca (strain DW4/3-1) TaxID=378806 RepID=E3FUS5_STIAD|nr:tail fiber protein [Stigmatella aurantiaca]ADO75958.1 Phage tail collar domain protein [Stigmatella aurantiaca DW4/3-1]